MYTQTIASEKWWKKYEDAIAPSSSIPSSPAGATLTFTCPASPPTPTACVVSACSRNHLSRRSPANHAIAATVPVAKTIAMIDDAVPGSVT